MDARLSALHGSREVGILVSAVNRALEVFETRVRLGADDAFTRYYAACAYALKGQREAALSSLDRAMLMRPAYTRARARLEPELASGEGVSFRTRFVVLSLTSMRIFLA